MSQDSCLHQTLQLRALWNGKFYHLDDELQDFDLSLHRDQEIQIMELTGHLDLLFKLLVNAQKGYYCLRTAYLIQYELIVPISWILNQK